MKKLIFIFLFPLISFAQKNDSTQFLNENEQAFVISEEVNYVYSKPKVLDLFTKIPRNIERLGKKIVKKENLKWLGITAVSTLAILPFDQKLLDKAGELGSYLHLSKDHGYGKVGPLQIIPQNTASAIYYIGNGATPIAISGGLLTFGLIKNDYRALHTSSELIESLIVVGFFTQTMKRISGRQSPFVAEKAGGKWQPFPSFSTYFNNTSNYDAFPSGHLATLMATVTVLEKNYPEKKWIKPVGYTLVGVLAYEMMNSEVHWASDYPIALLLGYAVGSISANRRIKKINSTKTSKSKHNFDTRLTFSNYYGTNLIGVNISFK